MDRAGRPSTFTSSIGFDGVQAQASVSFSALPSPTVAGVLTETYAQLSAGLPAALRPDLGLDLVQDEITFTLPAGETNDFVDNSTTDTTAILSGGFEAVPEPSPFVPAGLAALAMLGDASRRRTRARV